MATRRIRFDTVLDAPFEPVLEALSKPALMTHVCRPLVRFRPVEPARLPDRWSDGCYLVSLWLFGFLPMGRQVIGIEFGAMGDTDAFTGLDRGHSALMKQWNHEIGVRRREDGRTDYYDEITVDARWLTPIAAPFVSFLFRHRQKRLRAIASDRFAGLAA